MLTLHKAEAMSVVPQLLLLYLWSANLAQPTYLPSQGRGLNVLHSQSAGHTLSSLVYTSYSKKRENVLATSIYNYMIRGAITDNFVKVGRPQSI